MSNVVDLTAQRKVSRTPWRVEGFSEVIADVVPDNGAPTWMIIGADGETIVAQCLTIQDATLICTAVNGVRA